MALEQSILTSTKITLGVAPDDNSFDHDIITHINSAFSTLHQVGIGPSTGFAIDDGEKKWVDFLSADTPEYIVNAVKTNVHLRVRLIFDPPQLPHLMTALKESLQESDVRLNIMREATEWSDPDPPDPVDPTL